MAPLRNRRDHPNLPDRPPGVRSTRKRPIILLVVGSLVASLAVQSITADPAAAQTADLCDTLDSVQFSDVGDLDYGAAYILCMKALGLSVGKGGGEYGPDDLLTRGQMATFLVRLWQDVLDRGCPDIDHPFEDVKSSSTHATAIRCLYGLGITKGTGPTTYEPSTDLKASQISRFLVRVWELLGHTCASGESELARAGACLTALHVTPDAREATSGDRVTRAQMAVYLIGLWHNASGAGAPPPPPFRPGGATPGREAGYSSLNACRPDGPNAGRSDAVTAGFPLPSWAAPATGAFRVAVLFADFPDARASSTDLAGIEGNLAETEFYLETMSGRRLDVRFYPQPGWFTARMGWREYLEDVGEDRLISDEIVEETALTAEQLAGFDGAAYDSLMVVLPRSQFGGGLANTGHSIGNAAGVALWTLINTEKKDQAPAESRDRDWWFVAAHELAHNMGLADLYPYDPDVRVTPDPPRNREWVRFEVGLMGLEVSFPAPRDAYPYEVDWPPEYMDQTDYDRRLVAREMLTWSRWQLGWLDEARVTCLAGVTDQTVELVPLGAPGGGIAMVAIPHHADDRLVIVVESRRRVRYDRPETVSGLGDGDVPYTYTDHSLPGEGVMVYLVRADRRSGELPLLLGSDSGEGETDGLPVMARGARWWLGEPGTADGHYQIEVVSSSHRTDTIRVTFTP